MKTVILILLIASNILLATENHYYEDVPEKYKKLLGLPKKDIIGKVNQGLAHGPETCAPTVLFGNFSFDFNLNKNFPNIYIGFNFTLWPVPYLAGIRIGAHIGINFNKYIFTELGISQLLWQQEPFVSNDLNYATLNPKLGIRIFNIYFKTGPSFYIGDVSYYAKSMSKYWKYLGFNDRYWNVEIGWSRDF